jgi:ribosomal protein L20
MELDNNTVVATENSVETKKENKQETARTWIKRFLAESKSSGSTEIGRSQLFHEGLKSGITLNQGVFAQLEAGKLGITVEKHNGTVGKKKSIKYTY